MLLAICPSVDRTFPERKDLKLENFCLEDDSENARIKTLRSLLARVGEFNLVMMPCQRFGISNHCCL
jgi:hypothetical protein